MKIAISSDKAGFDLKDSLVLHLERSNYEIIDIGPFNRSEQVSFVENSDRLCQMIMNKEADRGILICGTGMGMSISANKHKGIYAAVVESVYTARMARLINDANILCMGGFIIGKQLAAEIVNVFLETEYLHNFEQWRVDFLNSQLSILRKIENNNFR